MSEMVSEQILFLQLNKLLKYSHKSMNSLHSRGVIPEGRSFQEAPNGFICLDCAKITNQAHHGVFNAKDQGDLTPVGSSSEAHPVNFFA